MRIVALFFALLAPLPASAGVTLADVDAALNDWKTLDYRFKVRRKMGDRTVRLEMRLRMRPSTPSNTAVIEVLSPKAFEGMRVLIDRNRRVHVRRPGTEGTRRMTLAEADRGLLATIIDLWQASANRYSPDYTVESTSDRTFHLKARPGATVRCPRVDLTVDTVAQPVQINCLAADGTRLRSETRTGRSMCFGQFCAPARITIVDAAKGKTVVDLETWRLNERMYARIFEATSLE